jgi:two-component system, chemotaxis family, response regulator Rcp1
LEMALKKATRGSMGIPAEILLVEDNPADVRLMQEAFREAGGGCKPGDLPKVPGDVPKLSVARNGPQALAFLRREAPYQASPRPALILLDLNLPGADGSELLAEIKKDRGLRQIPVIVFSTSTRAEDIARAYDLHANCYISKPRDLESLVEAARSIEAFWLGMAAVPDPTPRPSADQGKPLASRKSA